MAKKDGEINKDRVSQLINTFRAHEAAIKRTGFKATPETDSLNRQFYKLRADATPEEIATFEKIEF